MRKLGLIGIAAAVLIVAGCATSDGVEQPYAEAFNETKLVVKDELGKRLFPNDPENLAKFERAVDEITLDEDGIDIGATIGAIGVTAAPFSGPWAPAVLGITGIAGALWRGHQKEKRASRNADATRKLAAVIKEFREQSDETVFLSPESNEAMKAVMGDPTADVAVREQIEATLSTKKVNA